jgi:hypothetical protein
MAKAKSPAKLKTSDSLTVALAERMESDAFVQGLAQALSQTFRDLADTPLGEILDRKLTRQLIATVDFSLLKEKPVLAAGTAVVSAIEKMWQRNKLSANKLLDKKMRQKVEDILAVEIELSENARVLVDRVMKSNFVASLYTDVLHVTIVGFYKKINPLFGGLATKVLESQIKSFIQLFIKIVLDRATEFVVKKDNVALFSEFTREVIRMLLNEPVYHFFAEASPAHRERIGAFAREALHNRALEKTLGQLIGESFDAVYDTLKTKCLADILDLDVVIANYSDIAAELLRDQLCRDPVLGFLAAEFSAVQESLQAQEAK